MYKVFIENKPIIFQINPQSDQTYNSEETWESIREFLLSDKQSMNVDLHSVEDFDDLFRAHKKIEAAGGMVQRDNGFLFIKRNGFWDIPKGKLEKKETPEVGAIREIEEECGLVAPVIKAHLVDTFHTYVHKGKNVLKKTYWYWLNDGEVRKELIPQAEEGITEVKYFEKSEWKRIKENTFTSIIEVMDVLEEKQK